jgi:predicted RNA binding protein YcfA (HicA-like mRNA interferase family)
LPIIKSAELVAILKKNEFKIVRQKGSHMRMKHEDGRVTSVPVHSGQDIGRGLLRKILRDTELNPEDIFNL